MSNNEQVNPTGSEQSTNESLMFSFGQPEIMDSGFTNYEYSELYYNDSDDYWEPPLDRTGLNKLTRANAYHGSILMARRNMIAGRFVKGGMLKQQVQSAVHDFLEFGDTAILKIRDHFGRVVRLHPLPSMYLRKNKKGDYWLLERDDKKRLYKQEDVIFIKQYDPAQQVYGSPDYLGCVQSALLNSDATTFRRRYYKNGLHMGFIFYATDPNLSKDDEDDLKEKMASSRGVGNFRSMFINIPNGKEKGIQLIPVGDIATKDEFEKIKNVSAQEVLTGHRFPVELAAIIPNGGTRGDPIKFNEVYTQNEVIPACEMFMDAVNSDVEVPKSLQFEFTLANGEKQVALS
ncbi:phage portal protein [Photobacterium sp.]|uniref:phage portal protein n=1 Tax=Photobacterium sp. TaxID=660 RepID=UPI00299DB46E|nr:phage portal protein [Photobacterium sp.]MDX1300910.1 phage portal protein [Photobacterium sp.]